MFKYIYNSREFTINLERYISHNIISYYVPKKGEIFRTVEELNSLNRYKLAEDFYNDRLMLKGSIVGEISKYDIINDIARYIDMKIPRIYDKWFLRRNRLSVPKSNTGELKHGLIYKLDINKQVDGIMKDDFIKYKDEKGRIDYCKLTLDKITDIFEPNLIKEFTKYIIGKFVSSEKYDFVFLNRKNEYNFPKGLEKLYEKIYFTITIDKFKEDEIIDILKNVIESYEIDLLEFFNFRYYLQLKMVSMFMDNKNTNSDISEKVYLNFLIILSDYIDIIKFKLHDKNIIGIDVLTGKLKYKITATKFLFLNRVTVRTIEDIEFMMDCCCSKVPYLLNYTKDHNEIIKGIKCDFNEFFNLYDLHKGSTILINTINQELEGVQFPLPNAIDFKKAYITGSIVKFSTIKFEERSCMTSLKGNLLIIRNKKCSIESVLIKDILISDQYAYILVGYKTKEGIENSFLIPLDTDYYIMTKDVEVFDIVFDFYGIDIGDNRKHYEYEVTSPYYWKYRNKNYISDGDRTINGKIIREYKEIEIGVHKAKLGNPSEEAKLLAKKYHIKLGESETLIRRHIRHYGEK